MAEDNNIKTFSASDIEKYHKGQLSPKEMHALEKAALDDPFLAEAMEGYASANASLQADIAELNKRLAEKTEQAKVIPINKGGKSFPWLRIAVIVVLIAGAGLLSYQFLLNNSSGEKNIAEEKPGKKQLHAADTLKDLASQPANGSSTTVSSEDKNVDSFFTNEAHWKKDTIKTAQKRTTLADSLTQTLADVNTISPAKPETGTKAEEYKTSRRNDAAASAPGYVTTNDNFKLKEAQLNKPVARDTQFLSDDMERYSDFYSKKRENIRTNVFHGRVTDANNNALPFANITNVRDNVGTYSDAQGNFTLISPDSVLNVQVKSLGFESNSFQLRNSIADNRVLMQEDKSVNAWVVDTVKRNLSRVRKNTMTVEEPEPEDGWESYGTYVANNINIPETFEKKSGETGNNSVEISFEVNKNGDPVNLKIEKSLCEKCDKEAMRLIKEGPKWKRKAKKSRRATVAVPFDVKPE